MFKFSIAQIKKNKSNLRKFTSGADVIHRVLFENNVKKIVGTKYAVSFTNCTSA